MNPKTIYYATIALGLLVVAGGGAILPDVIGSAEAKDLARACVEASLNGDENEACAGVSIEPYSYLA